MRSGSETELGAGTGRAEAPDPSFSRATQRWQLCLDYSQTMYIINCTESATVHVNGFQKKKTYYADN
jgi:hypothetical protein